MQFWAGAFTVTESVYQTPHRSWPDALVPVASDKPRWTEPPPRCWRAGLLGNVSLRGLVAQRCEACESCWRRGVGTWLGLAGPVAGVKSCHMPACFRCEASRAVSAASQWQLARPDPSPDKSFKFAKYASQYLGTFAYRFNRRVNLKSLLHDLLGHAATTSPARERQIRGMAEVHA